VPESYYFGAKMSVEIKAKRKLSDKKGLIYHLVP